MLTTIISLLLLTQSNDITSMSPPPKYIYKGPFGQKITISIVIQFEKLKKAPIRLQFVSLMLLFMHTLISDEKREEMKLI